MRLPETSTGALRYTTERAQTHAGRAKRALEPLATNEFKQALLFIADYAVERTY